MGIAGLSDELLGIPIVNNLKILGHYYGKDKLICDFQNCYCKLSKMEKISNIWKQRCLTIVGKNVLINSSFHTQIMDFQKFMQKCMTPNIRNTAKDLMISIILEEISRNQADLELS